VEGADSRLSLIAENRLVLTPGWFPATAQSRDQPSALQIEYSLASHEIFKLFFVSFRRKGTMRLGVCSNLGAIQIRLRLDQDFIE